MVFRPIKEIMLRGPFFGAMQQPYLPPYVPEAGKVMVVYERADVEKIADSYAQIENKRPKGNSYRLDLRPGLSYAVERSLKVAVQKGDIDYLKAAFDQDEIKEALVENPSNVFYQEALCTAIVKGQEAIVDLFLSKGVDAQNDEIASFDAMFVSATGLMPQTFEREKGTLWQSKKSTSEVDTRIFSNVLAHYQEKFADDRIGFVQFMTRSFALPKQKSVFNGDFNVVPAGHCFAGLLDGARSSIQEIIIKADPDLWANKDRVTPYIAGLQRLGGSHLIPVTLS